jgi:CRP-like cAMP-binding protein
MRPDRAKVRRHAEQLRRLEVFRDFSPEEIRQLAAAAEVRAYADGEFLATEGTRKQRRALYVVVRGELHYVKRVRAGCAVVPMTLRPGDVGGLLTFLNEDPSPVSVRSIGRTTVFEIGRGELQALAADNAVLAAKLLRVAMGEASRHLTAMLERVAATSAWALDLDRHLRALPLPPRATEAV